MTQANHNYMPMAIDGLTGMVRYCRPQGGEPLVDLRSIVKALRMSWDIWEDRMLAMCSQRGWQTQVAKDIQGGRTHLFAASNMAHLLSALAVSPMTKHHATKSKLTACAHMWDRNWSKLAIGAQRTGLSRAVTGAKTQGYTDVLESVAKASNGITPTTEFEVLKLTAVGRTPTEIAKELGLNRTTVSLLARGKYKFAKKLASTSLQLAKAVPSTPTQIETEKEEPMLLPKQTLSADARKRFALPFANPFDGEVTRDEDMFVNGEIRFVRESAWQAAIGGRFVAIVGESGAGKTTMLEDLKDQILKEHKPLVFIEPSVLGMEDSDTRGKSIKSAGIQTAIVMTLNPSEGVAQSDEKRARQVKRMLEESTTAGHSHLLVIEEAHSLPIPTLKHLKRLHERMRLGRRPMLGILLLGHPELEGKLNRFDVREVMQRCEVARLCPLGDDLLAYLTFRAASVGRKLDEFITPDGVAELKNRLTISAGTNSKQVSLLYPLNVNNWMVAALNTAAGFGAPRVDRDIVLAV